jgi:hypothetical protein
VTLPRSKIVDPDVVRWYHCISRCVRRAFLFAEWQVFDRIEIDAHRMADRVRRMRTHDRDYGAWRPDRV